MITCLPVEYKAYDETGSGLFKVCRLDEYTASVIIITSVNSESWGGIAAKIRECLVTMELNEDG